MDSGRQTGSEPEAPALTVRTPDGATQRFTRSFHIGRDRDCELSIQDGHVSRRHAVVLLAAGTWSLRDLQSSNGIYVDGRRVEIVQVDGTLTVSLGSDGPVLTFDVEAPGAPAVEHPTSHEALDDSTLNDYAERYFGPGSDEDAVGGRTMMIRKAFGQIQKRQKRRQRWVVAAVLLVALAAGAYAYYSNRQLRRQQELAEQIFYAMKAIDVNIAEVEQRMATSGAGAGGDQVRRYLEQRRQLEANYEQFVAGLSTRNLSEQERLILRVTRIFGECDLAAPADYISEVNTYIRRWQNTGRFVKAATLAQNMGYTRPIVEEFLKQNLAPQFFYLAMQESDFEPFRSGPPTKWGIAKGMWQFIPETGQRYGLRIGPLRDAPVHDKDDERLLWEKATPAAARYIKDIYATDAQASGLLVIASYNWGEQRVIDLLKTMPRDPRERNFWKLLEKYRGRIPLQTYDYVFYIVAAAVIGENPRLFGFPIDSPLAALEKG
jgi:hypothetical protein